MALRQVLQIPQQVDRREREEERRLLADTAVRHRRLDRVEGGLRLLEETTLDAAHPPGDEERVPCRRVRLALREVLGQREQVARHRRLGTSVARHVACDERARARGMQPISRAQRGDEHARLHRHGDDVVHQREPEGHGVERVEAHANFGTNLALAKPDAGDPQPEAVGEQPEESAEARARRAQARGGEHLVQHPRALVHQPGGVELLGRGPLKVDLLQPGRPLRGFEVHAPGLGAATRPLEQLRPGACAAARRPATTTAARRSSGEEAAPPGRTRAWPRPARPRARRTAPRARPVPHRTGA